MNRMVGIVATVAMVMHFTWGCCTHSCHFAGNSSSQVVQPSETTSKRCCHRGHRHHDDTLRPTTDATSKGFRIASSPCQHHCEHCTCMVTLNEKVQLPIESWVEALMAPANQARPGLIATDRDLSQVSNVLPGQHLHALCERFLI